MVQKSSSRGFSMIELMVVVAIIGVLAAIGIPKYQKFQSKARQAEAKTSLAALFTAQKSFHHEWNQYTTDLGNIGFSVQGTRLRYKTGFQAANCVGYSTSNGSPAEAFTDADTWSDGANVNISGQWAVSITAPSTAFLATCTQSGFTAVAYGNPAATAADPGATSGDTWKINEVKLLQNSNVNLGN